VRLSGITCATPRFLLMFSSSISSLSMISSSTLGSTSFFGTPCIINPFDSDSVECSAPVHFVEKLRIFFQYAAESVFIV